MKQLEYYRHQLNLDYPERSDEHMLKVKHLRDTHFDENFKYLPKGFWHKINHIINYYHETITKKENEFKITEKISKNIL